MAKETWISDALSGALTEQEVTLKGWVKRTRSSGKICFVTIRDSTGNIQCVAKAGNLEDEQLDALKSAIIESSIIVIGTVKEDQRSGGYELAVSGVEVIGPVNPDLSLIHI